VIISPSVRSLAGASTTGSGSQKTVVNCNDSGAGSLRQVITDVPSDDTITFAGSLRCSTITLSTTITIAHSLTIDGPGARGLVVSGDGDVGVFHVDPGVDATISGLSVTRGNAPYGGGIYNSGVLTLTDCDVTDNSAATGGGGVWSNGRLTVEKSALSDNRSGYFGGAIYSGPAGTLRVVDSTLTSNSSVDDGIDFPEYAYGGGIYATATATITGSTLTDNSIQCIGGGGGGGGIYAGGTLAVTDSTLRDNTASIIVGDVPDVGGGGILNDGTLTVIDSTLSGNTTNVDGGGIANGWHLTLRGSTLSGNSAAAGPNIYDRATSDQTSTN
jgi:predicted outer membrane repeat protein